jgi:spore coat polysaccharide biosynthesis protein SpsF
MRKVIILQARLASSRFPKKVLADLSGKPVIAHIIERLQAAKEADEICVAIPEDHTEDPLAEAVAGFDVAVTRGSGHDVLGRFIQAAYQTKADIIVRATADNPFVCFRNIDRQLEIFTGNPETDYAITESFPLGVTTEAFTLKTLEKLDYLARHADMREHVTLYLRKHPGPFIVKTLQAPRELARPNYRLTLDTRRDYELIQTVYDKLYEPGELIELADVIALLEKEPEIAKMSLQQAALSALA